MINRPVFFSRSLIYEISHLRRRVVDSFFRWNRNPVPPMKGLRNFPLVSILFRASDRKGHSFLVLTLSGWVREY